MTLGYQDTFTDADDVLIGPSGAGHMPDVGLAVGYYGNTNNAPLNSTCKIKTNKARGSIGPFGGQPYSDFHTFGVGQLAVGFSGIKEVSMDVFPIASVASSIIEILFQYQTNLSAFSTPVAEYYAIHLRCQGGGNWDVYASYGPYQYAIVPNPYLIGAPRFSAKLATVVMADGGAGLRFGATRYGNTRLYDFWHEPAGGGVRTFIGSYTFPNYADSTHQGVGFAFTGPGASTTTVDFDNGGADSTGSGSTPAPPVFPGKSTERVLKYADIVSTGLGLRYVGNNVASIPGLGSGSETLASGFQSVTGFSCHKHTVTGTAVNGITRGRVSSLNDGPINLLTTPTRKTGLMRMRDIVMSRVTQFQAGNGKSARILWGVTTDNSASFLNPASAGNQSTWIAFYAEAQELVFGNWFAKVIDKNGAVILDQDCGVLASAPHSLRIDFDGVDGKVLFYIDEILKASVAIDPSSQWYIVGGSSNWYVGMQTHAKWVSGVSTIVESYYNAAGYGGLWTDAEAA